MSAELSHDLGDLELLHLASGLQLQLSSTAYFAASGKADVDAIRDMPACTEEHWRHTWISRASTFSINVRLPESSAAEADSDHLSALLIERIQHWELWDRLQVTVRSVEITARCAEHARNLKISLDSYSHAAHMVHRASHKLQRDVPYHDITPPNGIVVLQLQSVQLHLCSAPEQPESPRGQRMLAGLNASSSRNRRESALDTMASYLVDPASSLPHPPKTSYLSPPPSQEPKEDAWSLAQRPLETCESAKPRRDEANTQHLIEIIISALQLVLVPGSSRRRDAVLIKSDGGFRSLSVVAPEAWLPGFHYQVSRRAAFIPTIDQALVHVSKLSSRNAGIRPLMSELVRRDNAQYTEDDPACHLRGEATLARSLWQSICTQLDHRSGIPRRPCSLDATNKPLFDGMGAVDELDLDVANDSRHFWALLHDDEVPFQDDPDSDDLASLSDQLLEPCTDGAFEELCHSAPTVASDGLGSNMDDRASCICEEDIDLLSVECYSRDGSGSSSPSDIQGLGSFASHSAEEYSPRVNMEVGCSKDSGFTICSGPSSDEIAHCVDHDIVGDKYEL